MARRGARPKPAALRVVDGTHRNDRHGEPPAEVVIGPGLSRPSFLRGEARKCWDRYIAAAPWLDLTREPAAIAFCELWAEFRASPLDFQSARHAQMRSYMNELGLTDERNRGGAGEEKPDPAAAYFG